MSIKWMPWWLTTNYFKLWAVKEKGNFGFEEALKILNISKEMLAKTLSELEKRGFIIKERGEIDYRSRVYRLVSPFDITFVQILEATAAKEVPSLLLTDKLKIAGEKLPYLLTGSYAASYYHRYMNPPKTIEVKVASEDVGKWIAFLTDRKIAVFLDKVYESQKYNVTVKLIPTLKDEDIKDTNKTTEGLNVESLESSIVTMIEKGTSVSITEAAAEILVNLNRIKWSKLIKLGKDKGILRQLGCLLEIINYEAEKEIINSTIIKEMANKVKGATNTIFPEDMRILTRMEEIRNKLRTLGSMMTEDEKRKLITQIEKFQTYPELSKKWRLPVVLSKEMVRKIFDDLGKPYGQKNRVRERKSS